MPGYRIVAPRLSLVGGIDDATRKVVGAIFREQEDQQGYFEMIERMVQAPQIRPVVSLPMVRSLTHLSAVRQ